MLPNIASVVIIVFGAFVAGARDLSFDFYGYAVVFLSNITTAIYLATIARIGSVFSLSWSLFRLISFLVLSNTSIYPGKSSGLNSFGLMWCNGISLVLVCSFLSFVIVLITWLLFLLVLFTSNRNCLWTFLTCLVTYSRWSGTDNGFPLLIFTRFPGMFHDYLGLRYLTFLLSLPALYNVIVKFSLSHSLEELKLIRCSFPSPISLYLLRQYFAAPG